MELRPGGIPGARSLLCQAVSIHPVPFSLWVPLVLSRQGPDTVAKVTEQAQAYSGLPPRGSRLQAG